MNANVPCPYCGSIAANPAPVQLSGASAFALQITEPGPCALQIKALKALCARAADALERSLDMNAPRCGAHQLSAELRKAAQ